MLVGAESDAGTEGHRECGRLYGAPDCLAAGYTSGRRLWAADAHRRREPRIAAGPVPTLGRVSDADRSGGIDRTGGRIATGVTTEEERRIG